MVVMIFGLDGFIVDFESVFGFGLNWVFKYVLFLDLGNKNKILGGYFCKICLSYYVFLNSIFLDYLYFNYSG